MYGSQTADAFTINNNIFGAIWGMQTCVFSVSFKVIQLDLFLFFIFKYSAYKIKNHWARFGVGTLETGPLSILSGISVDIRQKDISMQIFFTVKQANN